MPRPIKKRIVKKAEPEEDLKSGIERFKEGIKEKSQNLKNIIIISLVVVLLGGAFLIYNFYSRSRAEKLFYEGYRALYGETQGINRLERYRAGLEALKKSYDSRPDPLTLLYLADGYIKAGALDDALKTLQDFQKRYSNNRYLIPLCYHRMAFVYKKKGLYSEALKVYDELYRNGYTLKDLALYESARLLMDMKQPEEASKKLETLKKEFPFSPYIGMLKERD
jgi:predicted negative regulator of RcsB-dependent stress response